MAKILTIFWTLVFIVGGCAAVGFSFGLFVGISIRAFEFARGLL